MIWYNHIITLKTFRYKVAVVYHSTLFPDYTKVNKTIYPSICEGR